MTPRARRMALWAMAIFMSWAAAVAALNATLAQLPVTRGDQPDHLE